MRHHWLAVKAVTFLTLGLFFLFTDQGRATARWLGKEFGHLLVRAAAGDETEPLGKLIRQAERG